jgi:UDP-GlcNAc3NAcA epimerase
VSRAPQQEGLREIIVHTGRHYDEGMSDVFFRELGIPAPGYHLGAGGGSHGAMTGRMLEKIEEVLVKEQPDAVRVYLDTHSTLAGALAEGNFTAVAMMNPHQAPDLTKQPEAC